VRACPKNNRNATAASTPSASAAAITTSSAAESNATTAAASATTTAAPKASSASASSAAAIAPPTAANTIWWFATNGLAKEEEDAWKGIFAQFEKENGKLKVQFTNGTSNDKYTAANAGGTYPDVHEPVTKELPSWVAKQADIDMTSYVPESEDQCRRLHRLPAPEGHL